MSTILNAPIYDKHGKEIKEGMRMYATLATGDSYSKPEMCVVVSEVCKMYLDGNEKFGKYLCLEGENTKLRAVLWDYWSRGLEIYEANSEHSVQNIKPYSRDKLKKAISKFK